LPKFGAKGVNELFSQFRAYSAGLAGVLVPRAVRSALTRAEQEGWRATMAAAGFPALALPVPTGQQLTISASAIDLV